MVRYRAEELMAQMKPVCVGRFLLDLPATMDYSYSHTLMYGLWVNAIPESQDAFLRRVAVREAEINSQLNEQGKKNLEKLEPVAMNGFTGKVFTFGRTSVEGLEHKRPVRYVNVALEAYVHAENTTFTLATDAIDPGQADVVHHMIAQLRLVAPGETPATPGFCFGRGMFIDPIPPKWSEGVTLFAGFKNHPDLALAFSTRAGLKTDPSDPGLLARDARADSALTLEQRARLSKLRAGPRAINGIAGEEVLERATELNFVQVHSFDWEAPGTRDNVATPALHLELSTGHPMHASSKPVLSFLNEDTLLALWDRIVSSIRVRPTSPDTPVGAAGLPPRPGPAGLGAPARESVDGDVPAKVGSVHKTGLPCPAAGWWRCQDTDALDGTRWFAQGATLRPATFQATSRWLFVLQRQGATFQRRSAWQLIRTAATPDAPDGE